ncbi:calmodulin binding protein isoform X1 [Iris pallida]|uniref:Calmodulin binding protein isoform X1 n=1 Tax=Iris pallida TaxID=29817 RepID=A0AAX6EQF4_IRIPA|nr:calmodulin binding protein isoform X1 [Iris pallida]
MASSHQLLDVIGKWSHHDMLNERLLLDADEPGATIPPTFRSLHHYFDSFRRPFLEVTRAHLHH